MPKVYKIVKQQPNGKLVSAAAQGKAQVQYKPGEWAYPPKWLRKEGYNGLYAFSNLKDAIEYYNHIYRPENLQLWEARAEGISPPTKICLDFVSLRNGFTGPFRQKHWPEGTISCKELKLLKQVKAGYLEDETIKT
jgi:hypothetical protein